MPIDLPTSVYSQVKLAPYRGLGRFVRPHWAPLGAATALAVIQTVLALAAPWPLKLAVDHAIGAQPLPPWLAAIGPLSPFGIALLAAGAGVALVALGGVIRYAGTYTPPRTRLWEGGR